jgi:putative SOS response-associated peptidase YedK
VLSATTDAAQNSAALTRSTSPSNVSYIALPPWDYNFAPTTNQPIIRNNCDNALRELVHWRRVFISVPHEASGGRAEA